MRRRGGHRNTFRGRAWETEKEGERRSADVTRSWGPVSRTRTRTENAFPRHEINRKEWREVETHGPSAPHSDRRRPTRRQRRREHDTKLHCTKPASQRDSSKTPCPQIPAPGPVHTSAPDMQRLGDGEGAGARAGSACMGRLPAAWAGRPAGWPRSWSAVTGTCAQGGWDAWQSEAACCSWTSS